MPNTEVEEVQVIEWTPGGSMVFVYKQPYGSVYSTGPQDLTLDQEEIDIKKLHEDVFNPNESDLDYALRRMQELRINEKDPPEEPGTELRQ